MDRKIIIKMEDFNREIYSFLTEVGAGMPMDWNTEALDRVRNAAIEVYENMGVKLEIDERSHPTFPLSRNSRRLEGYPTASLRKRVL